MLNMSIHDVSQEEQHRGGIPPFLQARKELESAMAANSVTADESRAIALICALDLVLHHHGCPQTVIESLKSQVMEYLTLVGESTFLKRAKYLLCAPFAKYLKVEPPPSPDREFEPKGEWKRWMKSRMCLNTQNTHLWYSFFQAKRAALPLSENLILETYEKHRKAMEAPDPIDDETHDLVMSQLAPLLKRLRGLIRVEYYDTELTMESESQHTASTRACYENSRKHGGALKFLQDKAGVRRFNPENLVIDREIPDLVRMSYHPLACVNGRMVRDYVHEEYRYVSGEKLWQSYFRNRLPSIQDGPVHCTIQAVLEPLKVRVISKGEADPYYICKPLQRAVHTVLRRMPAFRLIGKPLEERDLVGLVRNGPAGGTGPLEWFSIDYSAATDGLSARLSASIMDQLVCDFPVELQKVFKRVLAPHFCDYPEAGGERLDPVQQVNGQLMGSILSFPILCIANLGLYLATTRDDERDIDSRMRGVLVNGDDMLYCARTSRWEEHVRLGRRVGLEMSVGKAYHHPVVANANSMCFHYEIGKVGVVPRYIPFLNSGLFFGQGKVQGGTDEVSSRCKVSVITELVKGFRPSRANEFLGYYLSYHKSDLKKECEAYSGNKLFTRNLFLPESVGGMGQVPPPEFRFRITSDQRQLASTLYEAQPSAWFADGVHYQKVTGRTQYDPVDDIQFDASVRAPWLAPSRVSTSRRFPQLVETRMPKRLCRIGFVVTRLLRPTGTWFQAKTRPTPTQEWHRDYRDYQIEKSFREEESREISRSAILDLQSIRKPQTLQQAAMNALWKQTRAHAMNSDVDPFHVERYREDGAQRIEAVRLFNRRYGHLSGGIFHIGSSEFSLQQAWSLAKV